MIYVTYRYFEVLRYASLYAFVAPMLPSRCIMRTGNTTRAHLSDPALAGQAYMIVYNISAVAAGWYVHAPSLALIDEWRMGQLFLHLQGTYQAKGIMQ